MKLQQFRTNKFYCTKCGKEGIPIARKCGKEREKGHLKKLYCIYCQEETNHAEIIENGSYTYENFLEEFNLGRFVEGERQEEYKCSNKNCEYYNCGKCKNFIKNCQYKPIERTDNNG